MTSGVDGTSSLDRAAIVALVSDQLAQILEVAPADIDEDIPFDVLGADSLALIELVEALEESLASRVAGFHIDDEDLEGLTSVRDAVDYVVAKISLA
jgi:acyl carrier protein